MKLFCCRSCVVEMARVELADGTAALVCIDCDAIGLEHEIARGGPMWWATSLRRCEGREEAPVATAAGRGRCRPWPMSSPPISSALCSISRPMPPCGLRADNLCEHAESIAAGGLPPPFSDGRPVGSALSFMVTPTAPVRLHRIRNDQLYHYLGDPLEVLLLRHDGSAARVVVGPDLRSGERGIPDPGQYLPYRAPARLRSLASRGEHNGRGWRRPTWRSATSRCWRRRPCGRRRSARHWTRCGRVEAQRDSGEPIFPACTIHRGSARAASRR